jgi:exopolyphosphatase/guanosine-5'-triphosphate,3'-diphosphate pyrophosphatase
MTMKAAIDCGTNSVRLLVSDGTTQVERLMRITRLGQGVDRTGRLDPEAVERTLAVLREYREVMDRYEVDGIRMAATSASRDAANRDDFFGPAAQILGTEPELLSGQEEAEAPRPTWTRPTVRSWSSTSAAGRPSSRWAPARSRGRCRSTSVVCG